MTKKTDMVEKLYQKSVALIGGLHRNMSSIVAGWIVLMTFACVLRIMASSSQFDVSPITFAGMFLYLLIILVPVGALFLAQKAFPARSLLAQPEIRLARYGKWRELNCLDATRHPLFGATGMMASLVLGMLINVPFRSVEFLLGVPAMGGHPPDWFINLFTLMTVDLIVMNSLYVIAFVMAIRHVPWFPRVLLLIWCIDICSQLVMAQMVAATPNVPVAVEAALSSLLTGNMQKVFISIVIWLPYLLLSDRVNLTYRRRIRVS